MMIQIFIKLFFNKSQLL